MTDLAPGPTSRTVVIGAGVIGISIALELQRRGREVLVLDRSGVAAETSGGNAGGFAFSVVIPLATPGIMRKAPKWLIDPLGPLSIPPAYALQIAPWMLRFWRASRADRYAAAVQAQADLMAHCQAALERQIQTAQAEPLVRREGQLEVYEGARRFEASLPAWNVTRQHGVPFEMLTSADALADVQPGLSSAFTHGVYTPSWMNTVDPKLWTRHLANCFLSGGGQIAQVEVQALQPEDAHVTVVTADGSITTPDVVVAAGAWSHQLALGLGDRIPLETERGYNTTFTSCPIELRTQVTFGDHGFVVTRLGQGLRVGGAVELGGLTLPPRFGRADALLAKAAKFMPGLPTTGGTQWMGHRPSLPDSLPVIGRAPKAQRVIYAFGHGHLGLTQSAGTAELVASLVTGEAPALSLAAFSPSRF
ncbi:MAG: FAD-dependent oxidoreductase [Rhodobacteraceae bacterium]|nr:FAD-dependent oxidoreductase [Paracoccaceae bacterium]